MYESIIYRNVVYECIECMKALYIAMFCTSAMNTLYIRNVLYECIECMNAL